MSKSIESGGGKCTNDDDQDDDLSLISVGSKPPLPGLESNIVLVLKEKFLAPGQTEESDNIETNEPKNLLKEVCRYLISNGIRSIKISSNILQYVKVVCAELKDYTYDMEVVTNSNMTDVTVVLFLNSDDPWTCPKMWMLAQEAFMTSRMGVLILGHVGITELPEAGCYRKWKDFVEFAKTEIGWTEYLAISCVRHNTKSRIFTASDFVTLSPNGGCAKVCGKMDCGHNCDKICHPSDPDHTSALYRCWAPCDRKCSSGHSCTLPCFKACSKCFATVSLDILCEHLKIQVQALYCYQTAFIPTCNLAVTKKLPCGHFKCLPCSADVREYKCLAKIQRKLPCGHFVTVQCGGNAKLPLCAAKVVTTLSCGHKTDVWCSGKPSMVPRKLPRCLYRCTVTLKCGHLCDRPCHGKNHDAIQCKSFCKKMCPRRLHECVKHYCKDPCPPCKMKRDVMLHCGHWLQTVCSGPDPDMRDYVCHEECGKPHLFCKHPCPKLCYEECGRCEFMVAKPVKGCPRGHKAEVMCCEPPKTICKEMVLAPVECGHVIKVECGELSSSTPEELAMQCHAFCGIRFSEDEKKCGHRCFGGCWECYQGRFHRRCQQPCGKPLFCGHTCTTPCGFSCPPCRYPCFNRCEHKKCEFECGVPCDRNCELPCEYKCEHSACTKLCHEVCNKPICNEPCTKILPCNHPCVGFCGEICPPYCRLCDKDKLLEGLLGGATDLDPNDRFIYLSDCGHCVESSDMEAWLNVQSNGKEILSFVCPICGLRMQWIRRYSGWMDRNFKLVNKIRAKVFGNIEEIKAIIQEAKNVVEEHEESAGGQPCFQKLAEYLQLEFKRSIAAAPKVLDDETRLPISLNKNVAKFLLWLANEWVYGSSLLINMRPKLTWPFFNNFSISWQNYFYMITERACWPMHPNEMEDTRRERKRLDDLTALYTIMAHSPKPEESPLLGNMEAMRVFRIVENVFRQPRPYTARMQENIADNLKDLSGMISVTLSITETERLQILDAFNLSSGRWFKCANGHIYVVTECGGATEEGTCPECGLKIGGTNHMLAEDNYLATEMDGATIPIYPNTLYRNY